MRRPAGVQGAEDAFGKMALGPVARAGSGNGIRGTGYRVRGYRVRGWGWRSVVGMQVRENEVTGITG